jgi:hypothetical protein
VLPPVEFEPPSPPPQPDTIATIASIAPNRVRIA